MAKWVQGNLNIGSPQEGERHFEYLVRYQTSNSRSGIDGGKITKVWIKDRGSGMKVVSYHNGWIKKPQTACEEMALITVMNLYN